MDNYLSASDFISTANTTENNILAAVVQTIGQIIEQDANYQVDGLLPSSNSSNNGSYPMRLNQTTEEHLSQKEAEFHSEIFAFEINHPSFVIEDEACWIHMTLPFKILSNETEELNLVDSAPNYHSDGNIALSDEHIRSSNNNGENNTIATTDMQQITEEANMAIQQRISDGSFIQSLQFYNLTIQDVSTTGEDNFTYPRYEVLSPAPVHPLRLAGFALFMVTVIFSAVITRLAWLRGQEEERRNESMKVIGTEEAVNDWLDEGVQVACAISTFDFARSLHLSAEHLGTSQHNWYAG